MDNNYLEQLISQAQERGGGMLVNLNDKPAAVVLTVDRYNQLLNGTSSAPQTAARRSANADNHNVLVTGGAGYIGAHLVRQLLKAGFHVTVLDNLSTGKRENVPDEAVFREGDLADLNFVRDVLAAGNFGAVVHMAASIEVEESVREPQKYFENNVLNTARLLMAMNETGVKRIVFSSTAAVYGEQAIVPIAETAELKPNNPYGHGKMLDEQLIKYFCDHVGFTATVFRYFNACGCDYDGAIKPTHESHLVPIVLQVAAGQRSQLVIYGNDYDTFDGTCIRDYVHVLDIAHAHVLALSRPAEGFQVYNIGTNKGLSVKEIINGASEVLNRIIPMEIGQRRPGDAAVTIADNGKITRELGFKAEHSDIETIIKTSWKQVAEQKKVSA